MQLLKFNQTLLCFCLLFCEYAHAQSFLNPITNNLSVNAGMETRREDFRWSIAGNSQGKDPDILSEIIFNPVHSAGFHVGMSYTIYRRFTIDFDYNKLFTYKGNATDFDYDGDNRTDPSVKLFLNSDKGDMRTAGARVKYALLYEWPFQLDAGAGYSDTKELFYLLNDNDPDLKTTYQARWKGPGLSFNARWFSPWRFSIGSGFDYHFLKYNAEANWNTIEDFQHPVSFIQIADAWGWNYKANAGFQFNRHIAANVEWLYSNWKTQKGIDRLFLQSEETLETQMNGAFKKNNGWRLSAFYTF